MGYIWGDKEFLWKQYNPGTRALLLANADQGDRAQARPGSPKQNASIESFNGTFRDECLDENWFESLEQARQAIATWRTDYNEIRPHSSCGRVPPATFAALHRQLTGDAKQESKTDAGISSSCKHRTCGI